MVKVNKVKFSNVRIKFVRSYKLSNYNGMLAESVRLNRKLRKTERYMKLHHLLGKGEYLQFVTYPIVPSNSHNRINLIEYVAKYQRFIENTDQLKIVS